MKTKLWRLVIEKLFCKHQWSVYVQFELREFEGDHSSRPHTITHTDILKCTICGKIKKIKY